MKHIKYLLLPTVLLLGTSSLHATGHQETDSIHISTLAMRVLDQKMPAEFKNFVQRNARVNTASEDTESAKQIDSIVHYGAANPVTKTCYTYYENGDVESAKEYRWDNDEKKYIGVSFTYYGKGGESKPEYTIQGIFDTDGKELPETRKEYDWTYYKDAIDFSQFDKSNWKMNFDNLKWDNTVKTQQYDNGNWKTVRTSVPQIKDSYLTSLTYYESNANGDLVMEDSIIYEYNEAKQLVAIKNYSDQSEDGSGCYVIKYNDEGNIIWFGISDSSWYINYDKENDIEIYTEHKKVENGTDQIVCSTKIDTVASAGFLQKEKTWNRCTESEYGNGKLLGESVSMFTTDDDSMYTMFFSRDSLQNISNGVGMKITSDKDETVYADIYYLTESQKWEFSCTYTLRTIWCDDYTMQRVSYDENGDVYEYDKTCYHNPNATGLSTIRQETSKIANDKIYDLMGRLTNSKKGIRIINGKKVLFK